MSVAPTSTLTPTQAHTIRVLLCQHAKLQGWESRVLVSLARGIDVPAAQQLEVVQLIEARLWGAGS